MNKSAEISGCGTYRYWLQRCWDAALPVLVFIMLNPSTADADQDDPTIRKCIGFAKRNGFGSIEVVNLYAYRATKPADLYKVIREDGAWKARAVGDENDAWIAERTGIKDGRKICLAWGAPANNRVGWRAHEVVMRFIHCQTQLYCLKHNNNASPAHPLMLAYSNELKPF